MQLCELLSYQPYWKSVYARVYLIFPLLLSQHINKKSMFSNVFIYNSVIFEFPYYLLF